MQQFLTATAVAAVFCSAWPAAAQPVAQNRIEQSIVRESRRLAATSPASAQAGAADTLWRPVRRIPGGTQIEVSTRNAAPIQRVFVTADDTSITVLNPMDDRLPRPARRILHDLARLQPGVLLLADQVYVDDGVRLDHEGLWMASRLLASRTDLIERIRREDLRKLAVEGPGGSYWGRGLLAGMAAGALVAYGIGSRCGQGAAPSDCTLSGVIFMPIGAGLGAVAGGIVGGGFSRPSARAIYTAP